MFSRETIIEGISILQNRHHGEITRLLLYLGLEHVSPEDGTARYNRANLIIQYLIAHQDETGPKGNNLVFETFEQILSKCQETSETLSNYPKFINALHLDSYAINDYKLTRVLPDEIETNTKKSELECLLDKHNFETSKGHYSQAIQAHTQGIWAAANSQMRTFIESLFDEIANKLNTTNLVLPSNSHGRREFLAKLQPPFFYPDLNEWEVGDKGGFLQGFFKWLHPEGSHPGLSDDTYSTFRLHIVIIIAHNILMRYDERV